MAQLAHPDYAKLVPALGQIVAKAFYKLEHLAAVLGQG